MAKEQTLLPSTWRPRKSMEPGSQRTCALRPWVSDYPILWGCERTSLNCAGILGCPAPTVSASAEGQPPSGRPKPAPSPFHLPTCRPSCQPWEGRIDAAAAGRVLLAIDCGDFSAGLGANKPATSPTTIRVSGCRSAALLAGTLAGREGLG